MSCPAGAPPLMGPEAAWQRMFCVMRQSGRDVTVTSITTGSTIGSLRFNDFFRWEAEGFVSGFGYHKVVLVRNDFTGALQWGGVNFGDIFNAGEVFTPVYNFPLETFTFQGMTLHRFDIQNSPAELRDRHGNLIETLPLLTRIGVRPVIAEAVMGQTWCTFWRVIAVRRYIPQFGGVQWTWANMAAAEPGFVNTGLPADRPASSLIRTSLV